MELAHDLNDTLIPKKKQKECLKQMTTMKKTLEYKSEDNHWAGVRKWGNEQHNQKEYDFFDEAIIKLILIDPINIWSNDK